MSISLEPADRSPPDGPRELFEMQLNGPFDNWYERAGVRVDPRRVFREEQEQGKEFFPRDLIPYLPHEAVRALPEERIRELVARHLYQYLMFTAHLETKVVNRVTERIAHGQAGIGDPGIRLDAFKIYCDEAYHALYSFDLIRQIADTTGIAELPYDFRHVLRRLDQSAERVLPGEPVLAQVLQVVVFETVITAILSAVPGDRTVYTAVRELVGDHARDERRHHTFFARFFPHLWNDLPSSLREPVARYLPEIIRACLWPDVPAAAAALTAAGLNRDVVNNILRDVYDEQQVMQGIRMASRHTLALFRRHGVLDVPGGREAFQAMKLA